MSMSEIVIVDALRERLDVELRDMTEALKVGDIATSKLYVEGDGDRWSGVFDLLITARHFIMLTEVCTVRHCYGYEFEIWFEDSDTWEPVDQRSLYKAAFIGVQVSAT